MNLHLYSTSSFFISIASSSVVDVAVTHPNTPDQLFSLYPL